MKKIKIFSILTLALTLAFTVIAKGGHGGHGHKGGKGHSFFHFGKSK